MVKEEQSIRDRLILSTISCIEKEGMHSVTIRSIAREAKVNSAAINYYFGSKKKLVRVALQKAMSNVMANFEMFKEKGKSPFEILQAFFRHNFEGTINYPEITKAYLYIPFIRKVYDRKTLTWLNEFLEGISKNIKKLIPEIGTIEIKLIVIQMLSAMLVPSLFPGMFDEFTGFDFKNQGNQKSYMDCLVNHYLKSVK